MGARGQVACGVDLDGGVATAVEARRRRGGLQVVRLERAPEERVPVAACIPVPSGFVRRLSAPLGSVEKALRVLPSLLDIELPFPLESCQYDFLGPARGTGGDVEALAVAVRTEDLVAHLERLREAGYDPVRVEHEAVALWRASLDEAPFARDQRRLLIHLGRGRTSAVAGGIGGLDAATGLRQGAGEWAGGGSPALQRLALWWRTQQERAPGAAWHVAWCGPGAEDIPARRAVAAALFAGAEPKSIVHKDPALFLPRALAGGLLARRDDAGNLRRGALAHPQLARLAQGRARMHLALLAASALLLAGVGVGGTHLLERRKEAWQQRLVAEARIAAGTDRLPRGQELLAAQRALESDAAGWAAFARYRQPGADAVLARVLREAGPPGLHLHALTVRPSALRLNGTAADWNDGERLAAAFSADGWRMNIERRDAGADERVHFTVQGEQ